METLSKWEIEDLIRNEIKENLTIDAWFSESLPGEDKTLNIKLMYNGSTIQHIELEI